MCWDPARKLFLLVARGYVPDRELSDDNVWRAKRVIGIFESSNDYGSSQKNSMERWKYQGIGIDLDQEDDFGRISQHWTMQPFNYGNQYLGLLQVSLGRGAGTTNRVELMSSRDGRAWRYVARHSDFLSRGAAGHWDGTSELLASATPPVPIEDQLHLYMTGRLDPDWFIGMAKLRRDRFVGMMAGDGLPELGAPIPGESSNPRFENSWNGRRMPYIVTNKITVTKPILQVNLEVQTGGVLRVSIHKPYNKREEKPGGEVIAGFGLEDCVPLEGNATRIEVSWRRKKDLRELVGQDIVLMFQLKKATVWSYRFAE